MYECVPGETEVGYVPGALTSFDLGLLILTYVDEVLQ